MQIPTLLTFKFFHQKHSLAVTIGGLRNQIFHADKNGLQQSGAIIRLGRKILINEEKFFAWIEGGGS